MRHLISFEGKIIGSVITNHSMTEEEICKYTNIKLAKTEEDFAGLPENGMFDYNDLNFSIEE